MQGSRAILVAALVALVAVLVFGAGGVGAAVDGTAAISAPAANTRVSGNVVVRGTATATDFQFYKLEFASASTSGQWSVIGPLHREQVSNGTLGTWDVGALPAGNYTLKLTVVDITGNWLESSVPLTVGASAATAARTALPTTVFVPAPIGTTTVTPTGTLATSRTATVTPAITPTPRTLSPTPAATATPTPTPQRAFAQPLDPWSWLGSLGGGLGGLTSFFVLGIAGGCALVAIVLAIALVRRR